MLFVESTEVVALHFGLGLLLLQLILDVLLLGLLAEHTTLLQLRQDKQNAARKEGSA